MVEVSCSLETAFGRQDLPQEPQSAARDPLGDEWYQHPRAREGVQAFNAWRVKTHVAEIVSRAPEVSRAGDEKLDAWVERNRVQLKGLARR